MSLVLTASTSITLPNAQLQNTTRSDTNAVIRENLGQQPLNVAAWPKNTIQTLKISCMTEAERTAFEDFILANAGASTTLQHLGKTYVGLILTNPVEIIMNRTCDYEVTFDFMSHG